jgi:hypothetical protein
MEPVSKQRIGKHASATIELLLETAFSIRSVQCGYKKRIGAIVRLEGLGKLKKSISSRFDPATFRLVA